MLLAQTPLDLDKWELLHEVGHADNSLQSGHIGRLLPCAVDLHEITDCVVDAFELDRLEVPAWGEWYLTVFSCVQMRRAKARRF